MDTIDLAFALHDKLLETNEYKTLKYYEKIMLDDEVSSSLISSYHKLQELHSSVDTKEVLEKLHNAKLEMDNNINVINYRKAYKDYQILIGKVTDVVFEGISSSSTIDKIIKSKV